jgi:hypothetical protein
MMEAEDVNLSPDEWLPKVIAILDFSTDKHPMHSYLGSEAVEAKFRQT